MAFVDDETGDVVVRVVYDGAPEAGKTTNIRALASSLALQRRSVVRSPGSAGRMTEYFDWLDFAGGVLDGRRVRCQLVSVPGQTSFLSRRRHLLATADAVVFVADAHPLLANESRDAFAVLVDALAPLTEDAPVGIVLQANKQDRPNALAPDALAARLGLPIHVPVLGAQADTGRGVREAFLFAVRLACERVRALSLRERMRARSLVSASPDSLYEELRAIDATATSWIRDAPSDDAAPSVVEAVEAASPEPELRSAPVPLPLDLPDPASVPAGCNWPPVVARSTLAALHGGSWVARVTDRPWVPPGATEIEGERGVLAHTHPAWTFPSAELARNELLARVRTWLPLRAHLPDGRSALAADHGESWRLWLLTPTLETVAALVADPARDTETVLATSCDVLLAHVAAREAGAALGADPGQLAWAHGRLLLLSLHTDPAVGSSEELADRLRTLTERRMDASAWERAHASRRYERGGCPPILDRFLRGR